ncbi:2-keto-4-pentenoate hydratase [Amycolatopsis sp. NPDC051903]|uniref:2-keto-4-pentenoate hydratase n=1 Tax=Amycolatopsis sp. NPDC051903 TaxID=3363936 RepID=UPI0037ABB7B6
MIEDFATRLDEAATTRTPCAQLSVGYDLSLDEAYAVQRELAGRRLARGEREYGVKLGFTSKTKAAQMGVSDVIIGRLTSGMVLVDGGELDLRAFIHPRCEPEVAFRLGEDTGDGPVVEAVAPAIEVIDSRYRDFKFSLADVVADNTSAAAVVLGPWRPLDAGLDNRGVLLEVDGRLAGAGSTAAILGDPLRAIPAAVRLARRYGLPMPAGTVLLAGAATPAVALRAGTHVSATVSGLGRARFSVTPGPGGQ